MGEGFWARRSAALYLAAWLMLGLLLAGLLDATLGAGLAASLLFALPLMLMYAAVCGFAAYYQCRAFPLAQRGPAAVLAMFFVSAACAALLWCAAGTAWAAAWRMLAPAFFPRLEPLAMSAPLTATMFGVGMLLYGISACGHYLALEFARVRHLERRELELKLLAQDAELRLLRSQIDPHFLFNSLNSISALTAFDADAARAMTLQLAGFFRHTLGLEAQRKVRLADEIALVEQFVAIEQVRFGARLVFACSADEAARACLVPPMILQPLVENAVKHGVGQLPEGGAVRVTAQRAGSQLRVDVENDVDPDSPGARAGTGAGAGAGIGLPNVRQRLAGMYGSEASVHWSRGDGLFRVALVLPAQEGEAA